MRGSLLFLGVFVALGFGCAQQKPPNGEPQTKELKKGEAVDGKAGPAQEDFPRKIIYTARVDLDVNDFDAATKKVGQIADQYKGYVAASYVTGSPGSPRNGSWTIRVPVESFEPF